MAFENWYEISEAKRKYRFVYDNCITLNTFPVTENVKLVFSQNLTSVVQPMDQGVINNVKHFYSRWLVVQNILVDAYLDEHENININILQAAHTCNCAWDQVIQKTIPNCFCENGFYHTKDKDEDEANTEIVSTVDKWDDIHYDPGIRYKDSVKMDEEIWQCAAN